MNGNTGIVPTMPINGGNGFFGGEGIWIVVLLALMFGGNNGWGNNSYNNIATTDYVSNEFTQSRIADLSTQICNGFSDAATNLCNVRSDILTGNMSLQNSILDSKYSAALGNANTQRDVLMQTTQLENQAGMNALSLQGKLDECCCNLRAQGIENTQKILDVLNQNTIDGLRSEVNDLKNTITANGIGTSIVNQVRPYPIPAYPVSSPYVGLYNGGFYGNGFYGNTIV